MCKKLEVIVMSDMSLKLKQGMAGMRRTSEAGACNVGALDRIFGLEMETK